MRNPMTTITPRTSSFQKLVKTADALSTFRSVLLNRPRLPFRGHGYPTNALSASDYHICFTKALVASHRAGLGNLHRTISGISA